MSKFNEFHLASEVNPSQETLFEEALAYAARTYARDKENLKARFEAGKKISKALGREVYNSCYNIQYGAIPVKKEELPKLRKVCGKFDTPCKSVPYDYNVNQEIDVTIRPIAAEFHSVSFTYKVKFIPSERSKCQIVENTHTNKSLVCYR